MRNLQNCRSVFILANSSDDAGAVETKRLVSFFRQNGKEVIALYYLENEKVNPPEQVSDIKIFGKDQLNKFFTPVDSYMLGLAEREFDLLIDLSIKECFPLKYLFALSKSRLKVGVSTNYKSDYGDMTIDISANPGITYFITQVKYYLNQINQNSYVV